MDNFEKLFKEKRGVYKERIFDANFERELSEMKNSRWHECLQLSLEFYQSKEYDTALNYINQAIELEPENPFLFEVKANINENSGDAHNAVENFKRSLYLRQDSYNLYNRIALNLFRLKKFEEALLAFDIAIDLKRQVFSEELIPEQLNGIVFKVSEEIMLTNRANTRLNLSDFQGCLDDCQRAIDINPNYSNSYFVIGVLFAQVNQLNDSFKAFKQAERLGNSHAPSMIKQLFGETL